MCRAEFGYWFRYVCDENGEPYRDALRETLEFRYSLLREIRALRTPKDAGRLLRDYTLFTKNRLVNARPLVKDPIAVFSAEWLAEEFGLDVIVLIRHPAAFAGSIKKAHWPHPFGHFLNQPLLIEHHLSEFQPQIEEFTRTEQDIVDQAILMWNMFHYMILKYREQHPEWCFIKHETISEDPIGEFRKLYERLGLPYTEKVQMKIRKFSSVKDDRRESKIKRDSKSTIASWKKRLTEDEIERVRERTRDIASEFYGDEDW